MSANKHIPHILVLPEDDANRQIANGFTRNLNNSAIQIMPIADGWTKAVNQLKEVYARGMRQFPQRMIVLLIDFDEDFDENENRFNYVESQTPEDLKERVFVLGVRSNPEELRRATKKNFEEIGKALAQDCCDNTNELWGHPLLEHNEGELERLALSVKPFLFK